MRQNVAAIPCSVRSLVAAGPKQRRRRLPSGGWPSGATPPAGNLVEPCPRRRQRHRAGRVAASAVRRPRGQLGRLKDARLAHSMVDLLEPYMVSSKHDSSDRAGACRIACVTRGRVTPAWKSAAAAPRRTLCGPKLEASPPTVRVVLVASARNARVERTPASWRDGVTSRNSHGPKIGRRCSEMPIP